MSGKPISAGDPAGSGGGGAPRWVRACGLDALAGRTIVAVRVEGRPLLVLREGDRIYAAERACPHEGADLAMGRCGAGRLHCPRHQASFALADGSVSPGWRFRGLRTYPVLAVADEIRIDAAALGNAPAGAIG